MQTVALLRRLWFVAQAIALCVSLYQATILLLGQRNRRPAPDKPLDDLPRFALIICARNEAPVIAGIVEDLCAQDYPRDRYDIFVVAHNCTDDTAWRARLAGARVIESSDPEPSKWPGLRAGLAALPPRVDYAGIFDADARVEPELLRIAAAELSGEMCLQFETASRRFPSATAEALRFGRTAGNFLTNRPREALNLHTRLTGSGYFAPPATIAAAIETAHTVDDALEVTARAVLTPIPVRYSSRSTVSMEETATVEITAKQHLRWGRGHIRIVCHEAVPLLALGLRGDIRALDFLVQLLVPHRLMTRLPVLFALVHVLMKRRPGLPMFAVLVAAIGEFILPPIVLLAHGVIPPARHEVATALRHVAISVLWFPIGAWALVTSGRATWEPVPRQRRSEERERAGVP